MITRSRSAAQTALPPPPRPASPISTSSSSDEAEFRTPPETSDVSSIEDGPPSPPPPRPPVRRGRPPLSAGLGPAGRSAPRPAPAADGIVRRMKWTYEKNLNVMRAYYRATEGGTNLTAYRVRMMPLFQTLEPAMDVTAQRLSDQVRVIQRSKMLCDTVLDQLRNEALNALVIDHQQCNQVSPTIPTPTPLPTIHPVTLPGNIVDEVDHESIEVSIPNEQLRRALEDAIHNYRNVAIKPRLPRFPTHRRCLAMIGALNPLLVPYLATSSDLTDTHSILYCGAIAACRVARVKFPDTNRAPRRPDDTPAWQVRIERRISRFRTLIAKLISFRQGNRRPRVMRFVTEAFIGTDVLPQNYLNAVTERIDYLKQKVYAWASRIRRFKKRVDRYWQNRNFQSDQRKFYQNWEKPDRCVSTDAVPDAESGNNFWRGIWSVPVGHTEADWINVVRAECDNIEIMEAISISPSDVSNAIRSAQNWKSPGLDGLHNFWLKWFRCSHDVLAAQFQEAIANGFLPNFMTSGVTFLLHKSGSASEPKNYRPITCLPTIYKLLTSILTTKINNHIVANNILAPNQNGCRVGSRGTKELLLIDMAISQKVKRGRGNLSAAWIDYKKAYDSVPHTWLERVLELYKIDATLRSFLGACMRQWTTVLRHPGSRQVPSTAHDLIRIERGIFQGDSLSPLWFCLALNPLSTLLKNSGLGYQLQRDTEIISHLLYMDDLKLFSAKKSDLIALLNITQTFSNAINMDFGVDKCAVIQIQRGKVINTSNLQLSDTISLKSLSEDETYKYLGMSEALGIVDSGVKQTVKERFFCRLSKVLNSLLSGGNKVRAYNGWVMPLLTYTFGILKWTQTELDALDCKVRQLLTTHRMRHPRASVMRLYIPRKCGGRGFLNAKSLHNREVYNLRDYFLQNECGMHRAVVAVDKSFTPLSLAKENWRKPTVMSIQDRKAVWESKELHGRFFKALTGPDVDPIASVNWLRFGDLFGETEGFVCAIMDEVVKTNNYRKYIMKDGTIDICRACHLPGESLRHVLSGCSHLANTEYLHRHNQVAKIIHQQLALQYSLTGPEVPYYKYTPPPVLENDHATLYWDRSIITDRTILANKPDIVLIDRVKRTAILVDITIPHDVNLVKAEKDKVNKYHDLAQEIVTMWNVESATIVPIVVSVNGLMAKSLDQHLKRLSLGSWIKGQIQKAVLLDSARIVRKFLSLHS